MYCRNCGKPIKPLGIYYWWIHTSSGNFRCDKQPINTKGNRLAEEAQPMEVSDYFKAIKEYEQHNKAN